MFRLPLFVLLCLISASALDRSWSQRTKVEVTVLPKEGYTLDDSYVREIFDDYGRINGIGELGEYVRRIRSCNVTSAATYEAHVMHCNEFQTYLFHLDTDKFKIKIVHVKCLRTIYSLCLAFSCPPEDYNDMANCAFQIAK